MGAKKLKNRDRCQEFVEYNFGTEANFCMLKRESENGVQDVCNLPSNFHNKQTLRCFTIVEHFVNFGP